MRAIHLWVWLLPLACGSGPASSDDPSTTVGGGGAAGSSGGLPANFGGSGASPASAGAGGTPSVAGAAGAGGQHEQPAPKPNVIVILTDDQGWNGTSVEMIGGVAASKSDYYETPNIERLSRAGLTFSAGYAASNCSPSRLSLLTGKSPARLRMTDIIGRTAGIQYEGHPLLPPGHEDNPADRVDAIPAAEQTIAELIKETDAGYATALFGKWHLAGDGPAQHGFDESDGDTGNETGQVGGDDPKLLFSVTERATVFIRENAAAARPFYLQLNHYAVHEDSFALAATLAKYEAKAPGVVHDDPLYAAMTEDLDTAIGQVLDALDDPNRDGDSGDSLRDSTYVVLLSDNGGVDSISDNAPLAEGKATTYEGGIRVPFMVAGPGIAAGSRSFVPVSEFDLLPTIADWLGASLANESSLDGGSFAGLARATTVGVEGRSTQLVSHFPHYQVAKGAKPMSSLRDGDFKLVHLYETGKDLVFDLSRDLAEAEDLAAQKPVKTRELRRALRDYLKSVNAPMPRLNPEFGAGLFPDVDEDGLDDDWEFRELLTAKYSASDDPDADGKSNAQELAAASDPLP
jgi:arylsulfatase A